MDKVESDEFLMFFIFEGMSLFLLTSLSISRKEEVFVNKSLSSHTRLSFSFVISRSCIGSLGGQSVWWETAGGPFYLKFRRKINVLNRNLLKCVSSWTELTNFDFFSYYLLKKSRRGKIFRPACLLSVLCCVRVSQINKSNQIPFPFCSQLIELSILSDLDHLLSNRRMEATDHESCYNVTTQDSRKRLSQEMRKLYGLLFQFSRISNSIQNFFRILL